MRNPIEVELGAPLAPGGLERVDRAITSMAVSDADTHHEVVDITNPERRPAILMVVANAGVSTTLGWPVGFWAAELFHPYYEFTERRYEMTIASPEGGRVEVDAMSDPRDDPR